ncbi:hypothetical protein [Lentilactobacillus rapi]|uniref:hypothetical protein n=1 Tax=Lentilactobacillus rapi TaxID=481723 RepID=UPI0006D0FCB5|nr:hypothetical protein [Lentilactobacillus rapi]
MDAKKGQTVTFYYQADDQNNITVNLVDPNTNKPVGEPQQPAGHTGEELNLGKDSDQIMIPEATITQRLRNCQQERPNQVT